MSRSPQTAEQNYRWWTFALSIPLAGVLLYFAVRGVDWSKVGSIIAGVQWKYVAISTAFTCFGLFLRSLRWRILLNAEGCFDVMTVFCANMAGYLSNNFLPARAGEVVRSVLIGNRSSLSKTYVLTTALSERLMDVIALVLAGSLALWSVNPKPSWMAGAARTMALIGLAGAVATIVLPRTASLWESLARRLRLPPVIRKPLTRILEQIFLGLRAFHDRRRLSKFALFTVAVWLSDACSTVVGGLALGLHISFPVVLLLIAGMGFASAIPATPGFIGIYQFIYVSILTLFGISRDGALALALFSQGMGYVVTLALAFPVFISCNDPYPCTNCPRNRRRPRLEERLMKTISVITACFNEVDNVEELYRRVREAIASLGRYRYEHIFIDNASTDGTVAVLKGIAARTPTSRSSSTRATSDTSLAHACFPAGHRRLRHQPGGGPAGSAGNDRGHDSRVGEAATPWCWRIKRSQRRKSAHVLGSQEVLPPGESPLVD